MYLYENIVLGIPKSWSSSSSSGLESWLSGNCLSVRGDEWWYRWLLHLLPLERPLWRAFSLPDERGAEL